MESTGGGQGKRRQSSAGTYSQAPHEPLLELDSQVAADVLARKPSEPRSALAALSIFSGIGGFLFGYDTGVISGALPFIKQAFDSVDRSPELQETVVAAAVAGAVAGAAGGGPLSDFCGRKGALLVGDIFFVAGALLMAFAPSPLVLIVGRAAVGLGIGIASMAVPIYIAEAAPPSVRASLVAVNTLLITFGQFASYLVNYWLSGVPYTWRWMLGIAGVPALIQGLGLAALPESPRWLATHGKFEQAKEAVIKTRRREEIKQELDELAELTGSHPPQSDGSYETNSPLQNRYPYRSGDVEESDGAVDAYGRDNGVRDGQDDADLSYKDQVERTEPSAFGRLRSMMIRPEVRLELGLGLGLQALQQLVGINTVLYYMPIVIGWAGLSARNALAVSLIPAGINSLFSLLGMLIIDKCGRRSLMLGSLLGCTIGLAMIGSSFNMSVSDPVSVLPERVPEELPNVRACNVTDVLPIETCADCLSRGCGFCHPQRPFWTRQADGFCLSRDSEKGCLDEVSRSFQETETMEFDVDSCRSNYGLSSLVGLAVFLATFAPGMAHVPWAVNAEIYPEDARGIGAAAATTMNWLANLLVTQSFLTLTDSIGIGSTFYLFGFVAIVGMVLYGIMLPETSGLSLDEVQAVFKARIARQGSGPLRFRQS